MEFDILSEKLKKHGYSLTKARRDVFNALKGKEPLTMSEIVRSTSSADRASVYRTIALYEELGIVHKINIGWKYKIELTDLFHEHHHHLHCKNCGVIIPLASDKILEDRINTVSANNGFTAVEHQLEIVGTCANCTK